MKPFSHVRRVRRWHGWAALAIAAVATIVIADREPLLRSAGRWLNVGRPPVRSDYVIFLPGGRQTRPFMAAALVRAGYATKAVTCSTVTAADTEDGFAPPEHEIARATFERLGVDPAALIVLPGASGSTLGDARAVAGFMQEHPQAQCLVVTSDIHTRRARWMFERVMGRPTCERLRFVSAPTEGCRPDSWWQSRHGFFMYSGEFLRLAILRVLFPPWWFWPALIVGIVWAWKWAKRPRWQTVA